MYTYLIRKYNPKNESFTAIGEGQPSKQIETARMNARYSLSSNKRYYYNHLSFASYYALILRDNNVIGEVRYWRDGTAIYQSDESGQSYILNRDGTLKR